MAQNKLLVTLHIPSQYYTAMSCCLNCRGYSTWNDMWTWLRGMHLEGWIRKRSWPVWTFLDGL